jgi:TRAP-type C4-dicarboxylate transport system substrate-binding protein
MRRFLLLAASIALMSLGWATQAAAQNLRMLVGWDSSYPIVELTDVYAKLVKEASDGKTTIRKSGPEAVPSFEQLQPAAAGVFDLLFTHPAYHMGTTAFALGLEATDGEPVKRREVGAWDAVDKHYRKLGLKLLSLPVSGEEGFLIITKKPVGTDSGLKGMRIRAAPIYAPLITALGGSTTILPPAEIYSALERGVVDGAVWPIFGPLGYKWHEVSDYIVKPTFGKVTHQLFMNLNRWNALSEQEQQILLDAGLELEKYSYKYFTERAAAELAALRKAGMEDTELSPKLQQTMSQAWPQGVWGLAVKSGGEEAKALYELLKREGMTN